MAFKSVEQFNDDRYHSMFRIANDNESVDVIFLYRSKADMLVADVHYINSAEYSGYAHCCESGCPACAKNIRIQTKLFIPVYNINKGVIEFWDRTMTFEPQMQKDVFDKVPNPSEYVFRITRHGEYRDRNTRYDITVVGRNAIMTYEQILAKFNATMPDYYENIVKAISAADLSRMLTAQNTQAAAAINQDYVPVPRSGYQPSIPDAYVDASEVTAAPSETPEIADTVTDDDAEEDFPDPNF